MFEVMRSLSAAFIMLSASLGVSVDVHEPSAAGAVTFPVVERFTEPIGSTLESTDKWAVYGAPTIVQTGLDSSGSSWARLTPNEAQASGGIVSQQSFPSDQGVTFSFDFRAYSEIPGGQGQGDGLSFFLLNASEESAAPEHIGAFGGGLGYSSLCGRDGVPHGFLGIGFDAWGNFSAPQDRNDPKSTNPAADAVVLRGSGNGGGGSVGTSTCGRGYAYAAGAQIPHGRIAQAGVSSMEAAFRRALIEVASDADGELTVRVSVSAPTPVGSEPSTWAHDLIDYRVHPGDDVFDTLPSRLRFGFAASTGAAYMASEVGDIRVTTTASTRIRSDSGRADDSGARDLGSFDPGSTVSFSLDARNAGPSAIGTDAVPGMSRVYQDLTDQLENVAVECSAFGGARCGVSNTKGAVVSQDWSGPSGSFVRLTIKGSVPRSASPGPVRLMAIIPTDFEHNTVSRFAHDATDTGSAIDTQIDGKAVELRYEIRAGLAPWLSMVSVEPGTRCADGIDSFVVTATILDERGVGREGVSVDFEGSSGVVLPGSSVSTTGGRASVSVTSTVAGSHEVRALVAGTQIATPVHVTFLAGPPSRAGSEFSTTLGQRRADGKDAHEVTIWLRDGRGNPVSGASDQLEVVAPIGLSVGEMTESASVGMYRATVTADQPGTFLIGVRLAGQDLPAELPPEVVFVPLSPLPERSSSLAAAGAPVVGGGLLAAALIFTGAAVRLIYARRKSRP